MHELEKEGGRGERERERETQSVQWSPYNIVDLLKEIQIDQHSPCLTQIVRKVIVPPSKLPYNLVDGNREHSHGQAQLIKKLFKGMVRRICTPNMNKCWYILKISA